MGNTIAPDTAHKSEKLTDVRSLDEAFWTAVAEEVRSLVGREIASLRSEFETRMKSLEERGAMEYFGVYEAGRVYGKSACVTFNGSLWICRKTTRQSPGDGSGDWTLAVKKGRDGKDAAR